MRKAIFLDRDGTINRDHGYVYRKEDFEFLPGVIESLQLLEHMGFLLVIVTNQSGIARGYYSEEAYQDLNRWMVDTLKKEGVTIASSFYCPHHPDAKIEKYRINCECRKPGTLLYKKAYEKLDIDLSQSYAIGDKERDVAFCKESDVKGIILYQEETKQEENIRWIQGSLMDAAAMIKEEIESGREYNSK